MNLSNFLFYNFFYFYFEKRTNLIKILDKEEDKKKNKGEKNKKIHSPHTLLIKKTPFSAFFSYESIDLQKSIMLMRFDESAYLDSEEEMQLIEDFIRMVDGKGTFALSFDYDEEDLIFLFDHFISEDDNLRCEQVLQMAETKYPTSPDIMDCRARLFASQGNLSKAFDIINKALSLDETNVDLMLTKGKLLLQLKKDAEADEIFKQLNDPEDPYLYGTLVDIGSAYRAMERYDLAIHYLEQATRYTNERDNNEEALFELGIAYEKADKKKSAEMCYEKVLDFNPYSKQTWMALGYLHFFNGEYVKSTEAFDYAYTIDPQDTSCLWLKANSLFSDMKFKEAIPLFEEYTDLTGETAECYNFMADCYMSLQEMEQAKEMYERALRLDPDNLNTKYCLCELALQRKETQEAQKWCDQLLAKEPNNSEHHRLQAAILYVSGQFDEAKRHMLRALEIDPNNKYALYALATDCFEIQEYVEALSYLRRAEEIDANLENLSLLFALTHYALGEKNLALSYIAQTENWHETKKAIFLEFFPDAKNDPDMQDYF
jgi:tetratricopeptide (TPR) repeat protein